MPHATSNRSPHSPIRFASQMRPRIAKTHPPQHCDSQATISAREARILRIRQQIQDGTYETPEKVDQAIDRLMEQLGG